MHLSLRLAALLLPVAAAKAANATEIVRLSPAEREAVLAAAGNGPERQSVLTPEPVPREGILDRPLYPEPPSGGVADRRVHGEVSLFAGTGGTAGFAGSALVPVGKTGSAAVSIMSGRSNIGGLTGFGLGYTSGGIGVWPGAAGYGGPYGGDVSYGGFGQWGAPAGPPRR